ncbi:PQQ-dependent sugar dehydrogenase [Actinomycetospora cinnamomea]|uniref:Pyrroloquinoline quinone-dependent pyranose dehydrogenase beta-propeller domain-containing protein n=1 Tax=Actinomycetospora cinnamomea TaxID=663609 RepID=A0A2U1E9B8_9PSEU|nr:gluconolaconase [Actinomycetospora cinnamomea]PVY96537.1 hypothetical protein C8D89_12932 [Actinomycetospora cinnamomea]
MPAQRRVTRTVTTGVTVLLLGLGAACGQGGAPAPAGLPDPARTASAEPAGGGPAPAGAATQGLVEAPVIVPPGLGAAPFDTPRRALVPDGWSVAVWARVDGARLAAFAPDGALLVSRPGAGEVVRLAPGPRGPTTTTLVSGLTQPHGLAFSGSTLYVAESNAVRSYPYEGTTLGTPTAVVEDLPDARSPELGGAYAHALKSVAVGPDGAVYVSVGSTGNVSPADREATPQRAAILRVPPGGGPAEPYARGVRNGTGLAIAPDGALWTAVNNRDDIPFPHDRPPRAPEVSFYPWQNGELGGQRTLVGGFQAPDGSRWGRPVAAVPEPDGAVYVTDDGAGAVYRLAPSGR